MQTDLFDPFGATTENQALRALLRERIHAEGSITFRDYMATVAYHPDEGYYARRAVIGADGDFVTSPEVHPLFGALIARQVAEFWELLGQPDPFVVVEQGGGTGKLARALLLALPPEVAAATRYILVEPLPGWAAIQRATLGALGGRVGWQSELPEDFAVLLSNELVDSFPVHRVVVREGRLRELYVVLDDAGGFVEIEGPPSTPALEAYFAAHGFLPGEGCFAEVNLDALTWVANVAMRLRRGFVLTLDYGYPAARLYAPWRRQGTLLCFYRHSTDTDPYRRIGYQDITAHVDFTAVARTGREHGLEVAGFTTQRDFLLALGIGEALAAGPQALGLEEFLARRRAVEALLDSEGLGRIRVLVQAKGIACPPLLGFAHDERESLV
jgi:SAM-dependent MidA family methyltransferase